MTRLLFLLLASAAPVLLVSCDKQDPNVWQGYVEGEYVLLASPYAGQLQKLFVRRGDQIEAGKPVFVLEQENERQARAEAEERVKSAQARLENLQVPLREPQIKALRESFDLPEHDVKMVLTRKRRISEEAGGWSCSVFGMQ